MTRVLITGGTGFLGTHLARHLLTLGYTVDATYWEEPEQMVPGVGVYQIDVTSPTSIHRILKRAEYDYIYHLAGQAFVKESFRDPESTYRVNAGGTLNMLEAIRRSVQFPRFVLAGSGTEYGDCTILPTPETAPLRPNSPYGSSKLLADVLCRDYNRLYGIDTAVMRIFGTTGIGKQGDAINDFSRQIVDVECRHAEPILRHGNVSVQRDIMDVRDAVRAFVMIAEQGDAGGVYNVGSGEAQHIGHVVDSLLAMSSRDIRRQQDPSRMRPSDEPVHWADVSNLKALGWTPRVPFRVTLEDILNHHRLAAR